MKRTQEWIPDAHCCKGAIYLCSVSLINIINYRIRMKRNCCLWLEGGEGGREEEVKIIRQDKGGGGGEGERGERERGSSGKKEEVRRGC